jgi:DNA-binding transcriptional regulator YhcF (GntR family)
MTREEIGSYLGLKLETVSRTFSKFVDEGIVEVKQRHVRILETDTEALNCTAPAWGNRPGDPLPARGWVR